MVVIMPFDKSLIAEIEKGIQKADLGFNPSNDGKVIRISIPPLNCRPQKRSCKTGKKLLQKTVELQLGIIRRDGNEDLKKLQKRTITEDDLKTLKDTYRKLQISVYRTLIRFSKIKKRILEG